MAVTAESVVVELIAKTDGYDAKIAGSATKTEASMSRVERSAAKAEAEVQKSADRRAAAEEASARRVAEAAEKARIQQEAAQAKAALRLEELAARKAAREEVAAQRSAELAERAAVRQAEAAEKARAAAETAAAKKGQGDERAAQRAQTAAERAAQSQIDAAQRAEAAGTAAANRRAAAEEAAAQRSAAAQARARLKEQADAKTAADAAIREAQRKVAAESAAADRALRGTSAATRNLGRQVSDIGVGLAGGQSPFLILAQQAPQVADALADTQGKAAAIASFFAGPWGAALLAAGSVLAIFASKAFEAGESVDDLVAKLQANVEKTRLSAEAQQIFEGTAEGASVAVNKLNEALGRANLTQEQALRLDLARAQSLRQVAIQALKVAEAEARKSAIIADIAAAENAPGFAGSADEALARERGATDAAIRRAAAQRALAAATRARGEAEKAVANAAIPILDSRAAAATDKNAAATRRHTLALGELRSAYIKASQAATTNAQREAATRAYRVGREGIDRQLAEDTKREKAAPRGESAETRARRAEAARIRDVRNEEAFTSELEQLNLQIIAAQRERATTAVDAARFEREAIEADYRRRREAIAADLDAKKYSTSQAAELNERNEYVKALRLRNVAIAEDVKVLQELAAQDATTIGIQQEDAQARLAIAEARDERKAIELELIKLKYQERREQLEYLRAQAQVRGDLQAQADATQRLEALPDLRRAEETGVEQRYRGRYENYRRSLTDADALRDSIEGVQIQTLEAITDELTNATTAALGLKGAFGQIVGELIRIGIQRRLIGPLADQLFGKADGSSGGSLTDIFAAFSGGKGGSGATFGGGGQGQAGGILSAVGKFFGRASGGYVGPGQTVRVNEQRGGMELLRMGSQGGTVIPLGQANATARRPAAMTVVHAPQFNLRGAVVTQDLYANMQRISNDSAAAAARASYGRAMKDAPAAVAKARRFGTS